MSGDPTVESILNGNFLSGGWEGLANSDEEANKIKEQIADDAYDLAIAFHTTFSTPHGARVLDHLMDLTLRRVTWNGNIPLDQATSYGLMREGQNQLMAVILQQIHTAAAGPPGVPGAEGKKGKGKKQARKS